MCVYLCKMHIPCMLMYICDAFPYIACTKEYTNNLFSQCVFFFHQLLLALLLLSCFHETLCTTI